MKPVSLTMNLRVLSFSAALLVSIPVLPAADLSQLVAEASKYESGQNAQPLRQIEQLVRESVGSLARRVELEKALLPMLGTNATLEARRFACQQLAVIGTETSLPALAELLQSDDTVAIACLALCNIPSTRVDEVLREALLTIRGTNRVPVIDTLGNRRDAAAAKTIANLVDHPRKPVSDAAILALGRIATPPALEALATLRQDGKSNTAPLAVESSLVAADRVIDSDPKAALAIYEELVRPAQPGYVRRAAFEGLLRAEPKEAEKRILVALRSADAVLKAPAIAGVRMLKTKGVAARFGKELPKLPPADQVLLIEALTARDEVAAREVIQSQVGAADPAVRRSAIKAMGNLGDASTVPALTSALARFPSDEDRQIIETALVNLKGGDAVDRALAAELKPDSKVPRAPLIAALGRRGSRGAVKALLVEAGSSDAATARTAFQALGRVATPEDLPALIERLADLKAPTALEAAEDAVAKTLAKIAEPARRAEMVNAGMTKARTVECRQAFLRLLPVCGGARALDALKAATKDSDLRVRETAVRALTDWPDAIAWDALAALYKEPGREAYRVLALRGLVRLAGDENAKPTPTLVARYRSLLAGAVSDDDRKLILGALGGCAHQDALALALPLLSNPALKSEASAAVKRIAEAIKDKYPQAAQEALDKLK
jgi:HEAT repeat protein